MPEIEERPYVLIGATTLSANARGTIRFAMGLSEEFNGVRIWAKSAGDFRIEGIRDNTGLDYTNASVDTPIHRDMLKLTQITGEGIGELPIPLYIAPGKSIDFSLLDVSGASNLVRIAIEGKKKVL